MTKFMAQALSKPRTIPIPRWITPQNSQITLSECFGHASFIVVATSYAVDDFLMLRIIAVIGSASMLIFTYFHPHGRVLWLPFKWNVLFIAINGYRIFHAYYSRYAANHFLSRELQDRYETSFFLMDKVDYYRLMRHAEIKEYRRGDLIVAQGEQVPVVRMVLNGQLKVLRDGQLTYMLEENNFLSEAGIHIGLLVPKSIESCCTIVADDDTVRLLCWDRTELVHMLKVHEGLRRSLKAVMSWDIVRKLKGQRLLVTDHLINDPDEWTQRRNQQTSHRYAAILQAVLQSDDNLVQDTKSLARYRIVHHIDDETHAMALQQCGWTAEEFAAGKRHKKWNADDEDEDETLLRDQLWRARDWKWYLRDLYLRLMG
jgi:CRP-like cAMP-binding protein